MNLTTMRALIKSELHMDSQYVDSAIADAIKFCRREPFKFNGAAATLVLQEGLNRYPLPADFLALRGEIYCAPTSTDTVTRYKLVSATVDQIEDYIYTDLAQSVQFSNSGAARMYAIESYSDDSSTLLLAPLPDNSEDTLYFRYTKDIGTPKYTSSVAASSATTSLTNTITLLGPDGETLPATFTNAWFGEGAELIRARALYLLWSKFHGGSTEAANKAQSALMHWSEEMLRLRGEAVVNNAPKQIKKFI